LLVSAGPVIIAEQLPDSHFQQADLDGLPIRAERTRRQWRGTDDGFSAYSFDAWLFSWTPPSAPWRLAKPGTPEFRSALRNAILTTKELSARTAIYNSSPARAMASTSAASSWCA